MWLPILLNGVFFDFFNWYYFVKFSLLHIFFFTVIIYAFLYDNMQIWLPLQAQLFTPCTVVKHFIWFVLCSSLFLFLFLNSLRINLVVCDWHCRIFGLELLFWVITFFFQKHLCLNKRYKQVRHAQGIHNVEGEKDHAAYLSEDLFDAHLTQLGWQQVMVLFSVYNYNIYPWQWISAKCPL